MYIGGQLNELKSVQLWLRLDWGRRKVHHTRTTYSIFNTVSTELPKKG